MKTVKCEINNSLSNYEIVMKEVRKLTDENQLSKKQEIQLTLLVEETLGIPKGILGFQEGVLYVENEGNSFTVHFEADIHIGKDEKEKFIAVSKDGKNAIYKGFKGMLRMVADQMITDKSGNAVPNAFERAWYYHVYCNENKKKQEVWDEFEKSILANFADDIVIKIKEDKLEILVIKSF